MRSPLTGPDPAFRTRCHRASGVTLLDLLVTLAAATILLCAGVPWLEQSVATGERTAAINTLVTVLLSARREAIKRNEHVVVCRRTEEDQCDRSDSAPWARGLLVFVNLDRDEPPRRDDEEPVVLRHGLLPGVSITANRDTFILRPLDRRSTNGTFTVCDRRGAPHARALIVSYTGRARTSTREPDGDLLQCPEE